MEKTYHVSLSLVLSFFRTLRVQVPNNHILTQNLYYNYYYSNPKYLIIGYMDPLGNDEILLDSNHPQKRHGLDSESSTCLFGLDLGQSSLLEGDGYIGIT